MQRFQEPSLFLALLLIISSATPATAQVIVDATLPGENSIVTRLSTGTGTHFVITGGATRSTSLFHSFSHFDLSNGDLATFQNGLEIANIFARVTGGQVSSIDGLITANGLANLFVINPNGILLGPNAQLNIGGSFLASTADSVQFQHGLFSAVEPNVPPLLTIDIPLGLQMGENPGAIEVQGRGHALSTNDLFVQVFERGIPPSRLQVNSGQAIVLLGGDVLLDGGVLLAEEGHIDLGSVSSDFVYLTIAPPNPGLRLNYRDVDTFQDIRLINQALVDVSAPIFLLGGIQGGSIQAQGRRVDLVDGSMLLGQNGGLLPSGTITVNAQESLNLVGTDPRPGSLVRSGLFNSVIGVGDGGEVNVFTDRLTVGDGATLTSSSFGLGNSGNVNVNATTSIFLEGPLVVTGANSSIGSIAAFTGNAGQVNLSTQQLTLLNNSTIASTTLGSGRGGDITVNAREAIDIIGIGDPGFSASGIIATTLNLGDSGNILLNTSQLTLGNRGLILSSTLASGKGGSITLNADRITANDASEIDSSSLFLNPVSQAELGITVSPEGNAGDIQITAQRLTLENRSFITTGTEASGSAGRMTLNIDEINILRESFIASSSTIPDPIFQEQFGILVPTGEARDITITGNRLRLDDRASISVNNEGEAPAGVIDITTGSLALNNQSTISATNASGEEGDIRLRARELLLLQNDSQITTEASGTGNGGDIAITAGFLLAARNGDIIANAFGGDGGNINITADGILGTAVRDNLTPASDIVASSQAGSSGTITLTDPQVDVNAGLVALPSQPADPATQIANRCAAVEGSSFTVTGRGGLPENPTALLRGQTLWHGESAGVQPSRTQISQVIQEATEWRVNGAGQVVLAAALPHSPTLFHSKAGNRQFPDELNDRGYQWFVQGKIGVAIQTWQEAEKAYRQGGNQTGEWGSRLNQAQGLQRLGQYRRAHSLLQKVAIEMETQPSNLLKAKVLRSLGSTLQAIGNPVQAKTLLEESWRISSGLNAPAETAATLFSIGNVLQDLSQPNDAITYYTRTIDLSPDPLLQVQASLNYLSLLIEAQRWEQIHELIPAIQTQFTELSSSQATSQTAIYARLNFADRLLQVEQHDRLNPDLTLADDQLTIALRHSRHLEDTRSEAYTLGQLGQYYMQQQQWQPALQVTQQSLQIAQEINAIDIVAIVAPQLGEILKHQGELEQGTIAYQLAFEALQTLRTDLVAISPDVQFSLRDTVEPIYREFVSLLLSNPTQENLEQARRAIEALQLSELDNFFGDACLNAQPVQIDAIDTQAAVLYPIILDDRLEVILSLPNQPLRQYTTPLSRSEIEYSINLLRRHLDPASSGAEQLQFAQQLYDWLIRPEEAELKQANITTLVFVSDGNLRNVPMAALHDGKEYLIENYAIALSPGLQLFPRNATRQRAGLLVAGVTEEIAGFAPLPGVEREIAAITTDIEASVLLNQQFTRQTFKTTLEETAFPIVHLATHGQFSSDPKETFLLAWDDRIKLGDLDDIFQRRKLGLVNPIELLVMSACQTATGDQRAVLGLAGFALQSGARSTIASLWSVDDQATADLMVEFYAQLNQGNRLIEGKDNQVITTAEALRQAQLAMLNHENTLYAQNPYFWAGFVLVGNWL